MISARCSVAKPCFLAFSGPTVTGIYDEPPDVGDKAFIDFGGCVISPLFCDYHLHFPVNDDDLLINAAGSLICYGVSVAYDGGSRTLRGDLPNILEKEHLHVRTAGTAIYRLRGYGRFIGSPVDSLEQARDLIDGMKKNIDYLKIFHSGIYDPENDRITPGGFERGMLNEIVSYASSAGLRVWCHVNGTAAVREAVEAGVSAIIHGLYVDIPTLHLMASKGTAFVPTIAAFRSLAKRAHTRTAIDNVHRAVKDQQRTAKQAFETGVKILPGSDSGPEFIPYGESYLEELRLLTEAGIPYERVIGSAAASELREGSSADFVILDGFRILAVYFRGVRIDCGKFEKKEKGI